MKQLNFLLIPRSNNFKDIINIYDIKNELKRNGHDCISLTSPINDANLNFLLSQKKIDYVFRVDGGKPEKKNSNNTKFICWVSDINDLGDLSCFTDDDVIYTLKKSTKKNSNLRIYQMLPAANSFKKALTLSDCELITDNFNLSQNIDFSYITNYTKVWLCNGNKEIIYERNKKNLDKHKTLEGLINNLDKKYNTEIFGFIDYSKIIKKENIIFKGEINNFNFFFEIFRKSKFNVLFEDDFLDFNTNFFNILLVEGTLIANQKLLNQIQDYLGFQKETVNYLLSYNSFESFKSNVDTYYNDYTKRLKIGREASIFVRKKHLYKNRVDQLLKDLV